MKRILFVLIIALFVMAGCSQGNVTDQQTTQPQQQTGQQEQPTTEAQPAIPANTYKILPTDTSDKFLMKYNIDADNKWKIKLATFEIRNFGDEPLSPKITFMVGTAGSADIKTFEYDKIPAGYKMIKQETVNMDIEEKQVYIKATLSDKATGKEIGSVNYNYFAG